jgi:hypothetical protein
MTVLMPSEEDFLRAADRLGCSRAVIRAVAEVEAPRGAFEFAEEGGGYWRPTILFERHYFSRLTSGRFDGLRVPDKPLPKPPKKDTWIISYPTGGGYGLYADQHTKLDYAATVGVRKGYPSTRDAALKSCSWGMFQIMGLYHSEAGHETIQSFVNAMFRDAGDHLDAFVSVILARGLDRALRSKDLQKFKDRYNGIGANPSYVPKMWAALEKWERYYEKNP